MCKGLRVLGFRSLRVEGISHVCFVETFLQRSLQQSAGHV